MTIIRIRRPITKTALVSARICGERGYRSLVLAEWRPLAPQQPNLAFYRAQHQALARVHRIWLKNAVVEESALAEVWADAWVSNGGLGAPDQEGLVWLQRYVRTNPFFMDRRVIAVEPTLTASYSGRRWSTRPDALAIDPDGTVVCLEASGARHPTENRTEIQTQAALDQLALRHSPDLPATLRQKPHRVLVGLLQSGREWDSTLPWIEVEAVLADIDRLLSDLERGVREARPAKETCTACPFTDCTARWRLDVSAADDQQTADGTDE